MKEHYSIDEILNAVEDLQNLKKSKKIDAIVISAKNPKKESIIPSNTLKLIEEAEETIKSKLQSE